MHGTESPSPWITRHAHLVKPGGTVLDLACGYGRHTRFFAQRGCSVTALDRDAQALAALADVQCEIVQADIENGPWPLQADIENGPWPLAGRTFDAVIVTNYLWRSLLPAIVASLAQDGVLIYETFARGNETVGKPSNPSFLLAPGELLSTVHGALRVIAYEDGFLTGPERFVQRVVAVRESASAVAMRYHLP